MTRVSLILLLVLCSCGASYHLKKAEKHLKIAEQKGAKVNADTVYKEVFVEIPGDSSGTVVTIPIDSSGFKSVIDRYDSLVRLTNSLTSKDDLIKANREINRLKSRIAKGFSKDSVYTFNPDSLTTIKVKIKQGVVDSIGHVRKPIKAKKTVPVSVKKEIKAGKSGLDLLMWILGSLCVGFFLGRFTRFIG